MKLVRAALLFTLLFSSFAFAQGDDAAYFSLSSSRTYAPGEKPTIQMWSNNVEELEFRVYKVKDPVAFFAQLRDAHSFGGRATPPPRDVTTLERLRQFKRRLWRAVRNFFRAQFSSESREKIRTRNEQKQQEKEAQAQQQQQPQSGSAKAEKYPQVPLLNPQQVVAVWREPIPKTQDDWNSATINIPVSDKGVYLVEATDGKLQAYTIVMVSDIAIITKTAPGRVLVYTVRRDTGAPLPGAKLTVWRANADAIDSTADKDGLANFLLTLPSGEDDEEDGYTDDVRVLAQTDDGSFTINAPPSWYLRTRSEQITGYLYTDRPVYRPTHTVHYKAVLRVDRNGEYVLPPAKDYDVEVQDSAGNTVHRAQLRPSRNGSLNGELTLASDAALGYYSVIVRSGSESAVDSGFYVEEYKKPEYEVKVAPAQTHVLQGNTIEATIDARYYFGEPVANAKVTYAVHSMPYWFYPQEEDEQQDYGGGEDDYYYYWGSDQILEESGTLDADGKLRIRIPTQVDEHQRDRRYRIEARVADESNREITGAASVIVTYGSFALQGELDRYVYDVGATAQLTVRAQTYKSAPVQTAFEVNLVRWDYNDRAETSIMTLRGNTDANGEARVSIPIKQAGSLRILITADSGGRRIRTTEYMWVGGDDEWWGDSFSRIQIVADKKSYAPGDTARFMLLTGGDAHVLFTLEGNGVYEHRVVPVKGQSTTVDVKIGRQHAPGFFVTAAFIRESTMFEGSRKVKVPPDQQKLQVQIESSKPQYQPGEPAQFTIRARDYAGKPVAAEFSLGVVDEAIYGIRPDDTRDPMQVFYSLGYNRVETASSLNFYFSGEAGKRRMHLTRDLGNAYSGLSQIKPAPTEALVQPKIRKAFPDTVFWSPTVTTDSTGTARVRFEFPDSLTTWRTTARGITDDTRVGAAVQRTIVRKNVIMRLSVPRFFTQGDEITVSALVHNYLEQTKTAKVSMEFTGLEVLDGAMRDVELPSRGEAKVDYRVRVREVSEAKVLGKVLTNQESDAMEVTLPVIPYGVKTASSRSGAVTGEQQSADLSFPQQSALSSRSLQLKVSPSTAGAIFGALEYLTSFPYGCTEQTMSSFLPNIIVAQASKDLGIQLNLEEAELNRKIRAGMERLHDFQHDDGGWGWWKTDESDYFMTAYVVAGLSQAEQAGQRIERYRVDRGRDWLQAAFDREANAAADARAYAAYALALAGSREQRNLDAIWEKRSNLTSYGWALMGLTMELYNDSRVAEVVKQLESQVKTTGSSLAFWQVDHDWMMGFRGSTSAEATAHVMKLLSHQKPDSPLLPLASLWLTQNRNGGYYWYSTKQTAMVIYGLTDYLKVSRELDADFTAEVSVNGKQVLSRRFTRKDALSPTPVTVDLPADTLGQSLKLDVRKSGSGRLYWSARAEYYSTDKEMVSSGGLSLNLAREYFKLTPATAKDGRIVYNLDRLSGAVKPGDILAVRLTASGTGDWDYLMLEDPIPAGTEFITRDQGYELASKPPWWSSWYTRREFHDDHAAFFIKHFRGREEQVYLLKVVNPGQFKVAPALVQPMYQPEYRATSEAQAVEVAQ